MALSSDRNTPRREGGDYLYPVAAAAKIYQGALVVMSSGYAAPGSVATTLKAVGVAKTQVDNSDGANGALAVPVKRGVFRFNNSTSGDAITLSDVGATAYIVDDQTVAKTNGSNTRSAAGIIRDVDSLGVWIEI